MAWVGCTPTEGPEAEPLAELQPNAFFVDHVDAVDVLANQLILVFPAGSSNPYVVGDVLFGGVDSQGFLRRVEEIVVSTDDDGREVATIATTGATLTDAFEELHLHETVELIGVTARAEPLF